MHKLVTSYPVLTIIAVVLIMLGFTIDAIPVSIMEARNFISAREMLLDDNWILTTMNGEPRYQKPPLPTWITAIFGAVFGLKSTLALRFPGLIMLMLTGIYTYLLSKKLNLDKAHSLINGLIVITSFYVIAIIVEASWDIYTHGFMLMALYHLFYILKDKSLSLKHSVFFVVFMACSILSKGPVSLYVLFLSFAITYGITLKYGRHFKQIGLPLILLIVAIVLGGWWYYYVRVADPETFAAITGKETSNWGSYNVRPFYYYWSFFTKSLSIQFLLDGYCYYFIICYSRKKVALSHACAYSFGHQHRILYRISDPEF